jgi:hypothetical protein
VFNHQPEKDLHALRRLDLLIHHHVKRSPPPPPPPLCPGLRPRSPECPAAAYGRQKPPRCSTLTTACRGRSSQRPPPAEHSSTFGQSSIVPCSTSLTLSWWRVATTAHESCRALEASPCSIR